MLMGCYFGIFGADVLGSWVLGLVVAAAAGGAAGARARGLLDPPARQPGGERDRHQLPGPRASPAISSPPTTAPTAPPTTSPSVPNVKIPLIQHVGFFGQAIGDANLMTWLGLLLVPALAVFLFRTRWGLRLRAVGEKPRAADTVGLPVLRIRYVAVVVSGMLAALGGAYLSVAFVGLLHPEHDRGQGFHRAGGGHLRALASRTGAGGHAAVRLLRGDGRPAADVLGRHLRHCSRRCPICSPSSPWPVSSAPRVRRRRAASPT